MSEAAEAYDTDEMPWERKRTLYQEQQTRIQEKWSSATEALLDCLLVLTQRVRHGDDTGTAIANVGTALGAMVTAAASQQRRR